MTDDRIPLRFTPPQLDYIANVLGSRPWTEVQALLVDIRDQVERHNAARAAPLTGSGLPPIDAPTSAVQ